MNPAYTIDEAQIRKALAIYRPGNQVTEIRCPNAKVFGHYKSGTFSGYFDSDDAIIEELRRIEWASAVYFIPNAVNPALLARCCNRAVIVDKSNPLTTDKDIARRRWILVDVDPHRPAGVSSTVGEKEAALGMITAIDCYLWEKGFPAGVIADSGNGCHLTIPCDLPADDKGFCKRLLTKLASEFNTPATKVDESVFNAARIWKLPGTMVCKGDDCPALGRVWRMAKILSICESVGDNLGVRKHA